MICHALPQSHAARVVVGGGGAVAACLQAGQKESYCLRTSQAVEFWVVTVLQCLGGVERQIQHVYWWWRCCCSAPAGRAKAELSESQPGDWMGDGATCASHGVQPQFTRQRCAWYDSKHHVSAGLVDPCRPWPHLMLWVSSTTQPAHDWAESSHHIAAVIWPWTCAIPTLASS